MKKIRVFGLVLAVMAMAAFMASCSNPAGPRGDRGTQTQNPGTETEPADPAVRGGVRIGFDPITGGIGVLEHPKGVTYDIQIWHPWSNFVIYLRPVDKIYKDQIYFDNSSVWWGVSGDMQVTQSTDFNGDDVYRVQIVFPILVFQPVIGYGLNSFGDLCVAVLCTQGMPFIVQYPSQTGLADTWIIQFFNPFPPAVFIDAIVQLPQPPYHVVHQHNFGGKLEIKIIRN